MKNVILFGASGNIGMQSIDILKENKDKFKLISISIGNNTSVLERILNEFDSIKKVYLNIKTEELTLKFPNVDFIDTNILDLFNDKVDIIINALSGVFGLNVSVESIKKGLILLNANKESIVVAGKIINNLLKNNKRSRLYPIDSEHCAIFQCLESKNKIKKILLTASGGPFLNLSLEETKNIKLDDALKHPTWSMGKKITVDSATMFNKSLEIIEAYHLFNTENIDVIVHKESIVHSMIMFDDNSVKSQMSKPDMKQVINYFLNYPNRTCFKDQKDLDWIGGFELTFKKIDEKRFPPISFAFECIKSHNSKSIALNAANEVCVDYFLNNKISFFDITFIVEKIFKSIENKEINSIDEIYIYDAFIREKTIKMIGVK
ncbi:1-deoxy-D-xylulose 5-phosphate reductoisomerase [Spiroplasma litorale]|uniref:1-deoxy-D-xylulose 5-phosphate reductoisomerase n=1 Tax=Spiroplasma litorale TaxID=216942 RepID=A0A0K1W0T5_9MOLU|nr:1-deoxy-D-xylulose-5-phosphate reductoisomerase [Spiroplasma litorale]AKX33934.1 1-deoxy-D-xylulose 5-phosphate reductoisomerase [Spiroplasma litorale]